MDRVTWIIIIALTILKIGSSFVICTASLNMPKPGNHSCPRRRPNFPDFKDIDINWLNAAIIFICLLVAATIIELYIICKWRRTARKLTGIVVSGITGAYIFSSGWMLYKSCLRQDTLEFIVVTTCFALWGIFACIIIFDDERQDVAPNEKRPLNHECNTEWV